MLFFSFFFKFKRKASTRKLASYFDAHAVVHIALAVDPVDFRYVHTHKRVIALLRVDQTNGVNREREKQTEKEREIEWTGTRLGTSVAGQGAVASGAGTWRVNASTSKWLAGTIIALNALVAAELGVRWCTRGSRR